MNAICCSLNLKFVMPNSPRLTNAKPKRDFSHKKMNNLSRAGHFAGVCCGMYERSTSAALVRALVALNVCEPLVRDLDAAISG
jgi:hypothetical protein